MVEVIDSKIGNKTIRINNMFLHSKFNPLKEAERIADENYEPHHLHVLFGYGLGYIAKSLVARFKFNEPLLIIDPLIDEGILTYNGDLGERVYYNSVQNKVELAKQMSDLLSYSSKVKVVISPNYKSLFSQQLHDILMVVKDTQKREILNVNTVNLFAHEWQRNILFNLPYMKNDYSVESLFNKTTLPIVVASGGPSLTKQLPLLQKYRHQFILLCSGSTINSLMNYGIEPDYLITIDGGEANWNHYKDDLYKANIVYAPTSHYKIRMQFKGKGYYFVPGSHSSLVHYYRRKLGKSTTTLAGGGSVALFAYSLAKKMTSNAICLIGQDLAFTNNQTHATGNKENKKMQQAEGIQPIEGYYGDTVYTNDAFKTMKYAFEQLNIVEKHTNETFNCTEGGAKIESFKQLSFNDFLETYCHEEHVTTPSNFDESELLLYNFVVDIEEELDNYNRILKLLKEGIILTKVERGPLFKQATLQKLNKIEKRLNELYIEFNLDALMEPVILKNEHKFLPKENETEREEFERVKSYTIELYEDCKKQLEQFILLVREELTQHNE